MLARHALSSVFGGARARVLEAILLVEGEMTVRQVARLAGIAPSSASDALRDLERANMVSGRRIGSALGYRVNAEHIAVQPLRQIVETVRAAEGELIGRLTAELGEAPRSVVLFGSMARGQDTVDSDVDLLVVAANEQQAERWREHAYDIAERLGRWLGRTVNLVVSTPPTVRDGRNAFWSAVRRDGRILAGSTPDDFIGRR